MAAPNVIDLMELYAKKGVDYWLGKDTPDPLRKRAEHCLLGPTQIANREDEAVKTIQTFFDGTNASQLSFIPCPSCGKGIERCFFLPVREKQPGGEERWSFELLLMVQQKQFLAFRFEPAHSPKGPHGYGHVQMNRKLLKKKIKVEGIPKWLPDSYPAFPVSTSDPLKMFLAMTTAIHGYESPGGLRNLLIEIFQEANRTAELAAVLAELSEMLIREPRVTHQSGKWTWAKALLGRFRHWLK